MQPKWQGIFLATGFFIITDGLRVKYGRFCRISKRILYINEQIK